MEILRVDVKLPCLQSTRADGELSGMEKNLTALNCVNGKDRLAFLYGLLPHMFILEIPRIVVFLIYVNRSVR